MFAIPISDLRFEDVNNFCQARPREGLVLDYKADFPNNLEKNIASFANTYGGHTLIEVCETFTGEPVLPIAGVALQPGLRERVVAKAAVNKSADLSRSPRCRIPIAKDALAIT
jgi:hypothetical protein